MSHCTAHIVQDPLVTEIAFMSLSYFGKDNRPYWFDLATVLGELREEVIGILDATEDTVDWLKGGPDEADDAAGRYTGVDLVMLVISYVAIG